MSDAQAPLHPAGTIEAADEPVDTSEFDPVEWDASSVGSRSITASIFAHEYDENGRRYHRYRHGRYPMPNDQTEQGRENIKHVLMLELLPEWTPGNVKFFVDDAEDDWVNGRDFDFVHFRSMAPILRKLDKVLVDAHENMRSGGWIEFQELHGQIHSDDGTMTSDDKLKTFYELVVQAFQSLGLDFHKARDLGPHLEAAGFRNVQCQIMKIPIGTWPKDNTQRLIGYYSKLAVKWAATAFTGKPFEAMGISKSQSDAWCKTVWEDLEDDSKHRYYNMFFWYAQKV
ncbi:Secondary metabolism regulator LAE1 [Colletotrichum sp. SAR 10_86]|nr:Secondary metabolism regulator LAE1 [Colletotrichum sp. SAR 10_65]KAI8225083.1 Secondary metabolism regulator LAE1 [Colletotrichum sp. SAR 10_86]